MVKNQQLAMLFALIATMLWSTVASAFKIALIYFTPLQLVCLSAWVSCLILLMLCYFKGHMSTLWGTWLANRKKYFFIALLNPISYYWLLFQAYDQLPAQIAQSLNYTWSVIFCILAAVYLKQTIKKIEWLALIIAYFAVFIICTQGGDISQLSASTLGISLALLSTVVWSSFWIINQTLTAPAEQSLLICFSISAPILTLLMWLLDPIEITRLGNIKAIISASYVGIFEMGITFFCWLIAIQKAERPAPVALVVYLSPFISLFFIHYLLAEPIYPTTFYGLLLIVVALLLPQLHRILTVQ